MAPCTDLELQPGLQLALLYQERLQQRSSTINSPRMVHPVLRWVCAHTNTGIKVRISATHLNEENSKQTNQRHQHRSQGCSSKKEGHLEKTGTDPRAGGALSPRAAQSTRSQQSGCRITAQSSQLFPPQHRKSVWNSLR